MPSINIETHERERPILLILGEKNPLIGKLIDKFSEDFTIALISNSAQTDNSNVYLIKPDSATLIKNLEEKIEYAVIILEKESKDFIYPVFEKLATDKTKTAILVQIDDANKHYELLESCRKVSCFNILFFGDVYSEDIEFNPDSETSGFIEEALGKHKVSLTGNDLKPIFAIYLKDAINGLSQVLFGKNQKSKVFFLFYKHPQTFLAAIHELEHVLPEVEIHYSEENNGEFDKSNDTVGNEILEGIGVNPVYLDNYYEGFEKSIRHFIDRGPIVQKELPKIVAVPNKLIKKQKRKIKPFTSAFIWAVLLFLILNAIFAGGCILLLKNSIMDFQKNDYKSMKNNILTAHVFFSITNPLAIILTKSASFFGFTGLEQNYSLFSEGINLLNTASQDFDGLSELTRGVDRSSLDQKISDAFFLYFTGQRLRNDIKSDILSNIITPDLSNVLSVSQIAPQILGFDKEKKYLLLLQNNGELRPDGGFIGSVGELDIKNGKIDSLKLQDVYEYDGQLKAHVEPYYILRRYIQPHLYLRDSNFDLDFQESASKSALLYYLESGKRVDGVIAINFEAVKQIIGAVGPIYLASYNQTLDSNNIFDFLEKTIDDNFFPGSTQKKDVLQALLDKVMSQLQDKNSLIKVARLIPQLARQKQILFAFNENSVQSVFSAQDFAGEYQDFRPIDANGVNDFISVNEANIGVNKANVNVNREINYAVDLSSAKIKSNILETLENNSDNEYKAYVRFAAPLGSSLTGILINGVRQVTVPAVTDYQVYEKKTFKPPTQLEVNSAVETNHQVFGFIVTVTKKSKMTIEVDYTNGISRPSGPIINYSLRTVKQPGITGFPLTLGLVYGNDYVPQEVKNAALEQNKIVINDNVREDKEFNVKLIKNSQ